MKSLNDIIWNDEELEIDAQEISASSSSLMPDLCIDIPTPIGNCLVTPTLSVCNVTTMTLCTGGGIDPLHINGCILPMGVSCGGSSWGPEKTIGTCSPISAPYC